MESSPASGEYGVYIYCNNRLIVRALKTYDVGFTKGLAGLPHPSISLVRVMVYLYGEASLMPWNSSKSGINTHHPIFLAIHKWLVQIVKDYASLSRRLEGEWPEKVFQYKSGKFVNVNVDDPFRANKSYLPQLPKSKPRYGDIIKQWNRKIAKIKPWVTGLYEGIIAVDLIFNQKLEQKNRICLILLDSCLEIAFKEYLVNESPIHYTDGDISRLFKSRNLVHNEIKQYVTLDVSVWKKIKYYYGLRCKLIHESVNAQISNDEIIDFNDVVSEVLHKMYKLRF